jgi:alpha-glucosidase
MKKPFLLMWLVIMLATSVFAEGRYQVSSPDGSIRIHIILTDQVYYGLEVDGNEVIEPSPVSMTTSQGTLGHNPVVAKSEKESANRLIPTVWGIRKEVKDMYNQLRLDFQGGYSLLFRAYDEGIAYRFITNLKGELIVYDEMVQYRFNDNHSMVNHVVDSYTTSYEKFYTRQKITGFGPENLISLPSIVDAGIVKLAIMEADLFEYPGMYISKHSAHSWNRFSGKFAKYPLKEELGGTRLFNKVVTGRADYIARTTGKREFPWRVVGIAREDRELLDSDLVYKLARPAMIDTDWIRPGKVAWDWWNALNLEGVDFETGVNTESYKYFIDFAAENGISYVILDEWWSDQFDVFLPNPDVDMEYLTSYAKEKGVGLILWAVWHTIDRQKEEAFQMLRDWGIAGVKVDFIDRDDQLAVEFYERFAREAARYNLLVDYHGCSKPTGLHRTYPNLINYEAVRGNEYNKFSQQPVTPGHNLDIAFIRMLAGPMDYTPGAMENVVEGDFLTSFENPMSYGTRCQQLAMVVMYFSPLQMLCDAPTQYEKYPDILGFLSEVPTTWDETVALDGKLGEYGIIARRKGDDWYIGGMTDWNERIFRIDLASFAEGRYRAEIFRDGINAHRQAEDYIHETREVSGSETLEINMKPGGGFVVVLKKI